MKDLLSAALLIAGIAGNGHASESSIVRAGDDWLAMAPDGSGLVLASTRVGPEPEPAHPGGFSWDVVQVEGPGTFTKGLWTSAAARGESIHFAYWVCKSGSPARSVIHYALSTDSGATWTVEAVDTTSNYGSGACYMAWFRGGLDLDAAGRPHVAYTVSATGTGSFCIHAVRTGPGNWLRDTVEMSANAGLICHDADLKIDRQDRVHVAYVYNGYQPRYAVQSGDSWLLRDVAGDSTVGLALALDSLGHPHIASGAISSMRYCYSSDGGATWLREVFSGSWWHCDIALGADGEPLVVHSVGSMSTSNVWLSRRTGPGSWSRVQVDDGSNNPYRPAVYYDRARREIHIAYYGGGRLKHSWSTNNGQTWEKENVASAYMNSTANVPDYVRGAPGRFIPFEGTGSTVAVARDLNPTGLAERPAAGRPGPAIQARPNPSAAEAVVHWSLPAAGSFSLKLFDPAGRLVSIVAAGRSPAGTRSALLPRTGRGVYLLRLETGAGSVTRELVLN